MEKITGKYQDWTRGQEEALLNILGEENARKLLSGELSVEFKKVIRKMFDKNGRRISKDLQANVCDPNKDFNLSMARPETIKGFSNILSGFAKILGKDLGITAEEFKTETERLLSLITSDDQIANIKNGTYLPLVLPRLESDDIGTALDQYLEIVDKSYKKSFSGKRKFYNCWKGRLSGNVSIVGGSRQDQLIEKMKQSSVVVTFFPNSLQGFSVDASREQVVTLPEGFILSGIETIIAMIMYPEILARDFNTPGLGLAAFNWPSPAYSLHFKARDAGLVFCNMDHLSDADNRYSCGLSFLR